MLLNEDWREGPIRLLRENGIIRCDGVNQPLQHYPWVDRFGTKTGTHKVFLRYLQETLYAPVLLCELRTLIVR